MRKERGWELVADIFVRAVNLNFIRKQATASNICFVFENYLQEKIDKDSLTEIKEIVFKSWLLKLRIENSALRNEIKLLELGAVDYINDYFGKEVVSRMIFF